VRAPLTGPKSLAEWIRVYEERDSDTEYVLYPGEELRWHPLHGFFTFIYDPAVRLLLIPKMCGDGKFWRKLIYQMVLRTRGEPWLTKGAYCCTKRNPKAYMRILGGTLDKQEVTENGQVLSYILITPEDFKERSDCDVADACDCVSDPHSAGDGFGEGGRIDDDGRSDGTKVPEPPESRELVLCGGEPDHRGVLRDAYSNTGRQRGGRAIDYHDEEEEKYVGVVVG
jgi:hypothetical protein